jgi:hypothetical protein
MQDRSCRQVDACRAVPTHRDLKCSPVWLGPEPVQGCAAACQQARQQLQSRHRQLHVKDAAAGVTSTHWQGQGAAAAAAEALQRVMWVM